MIFVTVGAQMPFDRLCRAVDEWADRRARRDVVAQIGATRWRPRNMRWSRLLEPCAYRRTLSAADAVVTHAGIGTILSALGAGKRILVMPRRGGLRETRNDHQLDTVRAFATDDRIAIARDEDDLLEQLDRLEARPAPAPIPSHASIDLLETLRCFIQTGTCRLGAARPEAAGPFRLSAPAGAPDWERSTRRAA